MRRLRQQCELQADDEQPRRQHFHVELAAALARRVRKLARRRHRALERRSERAAVAVARRARREAGRARGGRGGAAIGRLRLRLRRRFGGDGGRQLLGEVGAARAHRRAPRLRVRAPHLEHRLAQPVDVVLQTLADRLRRRGDVGLRHQQVVAVAARDVEEGDGRLGKRRRQEGDDAGHLPRERAQVDLEGAPLVRRVRDGRRLAQLVEGGTAAVVHHQREPVLLLREREEPRRVARHRDDRLEQRVRRRLQLARRHRADVQRVLEQGHVDVGGRDDFAGLGYLHRRRERRQRPQQFVWRLVAPRRRVARGNAGRDHSNFVAARGTVSKSCETRRDCTDRNEVVPKNDSHAAR